MIAKQVAEVLAETKIKEIEERSRIKLTLLKDKTKTFEFGWMFFYQSEEYVKTGNLDALVGGNSPIIVDNRNSNIIVTGTRMDSDFYIRKYSEFKDDPEAFRKAIG